MMADFGGVTYGHEYINVHENAAAVAPPPHPAELLKGKREEKGDFFLEPRPSTTAGGKIASRKTLPNLFCLKASSSPRPFPPPPASSSFTSTSTGTTATAPPAPVVTVKAFPSSRGERGRVRPSHCKRKGGGGRWQQHPSSGSGQSVMTARERDLPGVAMLGKPESRRHARQSLAATMSVTTTTSGGSRTAETLTAPESCLPQGQGHGPGRDWNPELFLNDLECRMESHGGGHGVTGVCAQAGLSDLPPCLSRSLRTPNLLSRYGPTLHRPSTVSIGYRRVLPAAAGDSDRRLVSAFEGQVRPW